MRHDFTGPPDEDYNLPDDVPLPEYPNLPAGLRDTDAYAAAMTHVDTVALEPDYVRRDRLVLHVLAAVSIPAPCASLHVYGEDELRLLLEFDPPVDSADDSEVVAVPLSHALVLGAGEWIQQQLGAAPTGGTVRGT